MELTEVLKRPLITEKGTALQVLNKYLFEVAREANKAQVQDAVEKIFKVTVTGVNLLNMKPKTRRVGRRVVHTHPWKKAVVTLKPGDKIEIFESK